MVVIFGQKILKIGGWYLIPGIIGTNYNDQKKDNPYLAGKKVIFDYLRTLDNKKFHFRMLYQFIFYFIYTYSKKVRKNEKATGDIRKKSEKKLVPMIPGIRYQV